MFDRMSRHTLRAAKLLRLSTACAAGEGDEHASLADEWRREDSKGEV